MSVSWPSTLPPPDEGLEEEFYKPQQKDEFESNYVQSCPTVSRSRRKFPLAWALMTEAEYLILEAFFDDNQGGSFTYTHPLKSTTHTCVFSANSIKSKWRSGGWRKDIACPIEEV